MMIIRIAKEQKLYVWIPLIIVAFAGGILLGRHRRPSSDFSKFPALLERGGQEMVYIQRGSNLFHFSDCQFFSDRMIAVGPAGEVCAKGSFKPCPRCMIIAQDKNGATRFYAWHHGKEMSEASAKQGDIFDQIAPPKP